MEEAVAEDLLALMALVPPRSSVFVAGFGANPAGLMDALVHTSKGRQLDLIASVMLSGPTPLAGWSAAAGRVRLLYVAAAMAQGVEDGWADPLPLPLSQVPALLMDGRLPVDVACIEVTPPDADGRCHLGLSVDVVPHVVRAADVVLAEVNTNLPRTCGSSWLPADEITAWCRVDRPLPVQVAPPPTPVDRRIAERVAALVPDEATIQLGVGAVMEAVADALLGHGGLGIHTGLLTDGLMRLLLAGAADNRHKGRDQARAVATSVIGSAALHRFVADNPAVALEPVSVTHNPTVLAVLPRFTAINSAWEVALDGAVNAEVVGGRSIGGIGGQLDFIMGARLSAGGRSIIALRSSTRRGTRSRIVPRLEADVPVTTPRGLAQWVVTEHGAVDLSAVGVADRAEALIEVAAPEHRKALAAAQRPLAARVVV